jgi:hypothetical protein
MPVPGRGPGAGAVGRGQQRLTRLQLIANFNVQLLTVVPVHRGGSTTATPRYAVQHAPGTRPQMTLQGDTFSMLDPTRIDLPMTIKQKRTRSQTASSLSR